METPYSPGDKIEYMLYDKKGAAHWFAGAIHGVKRYEDPATNMIIRITYLVDTGRNTRLDKIPFDPRAREVNKRANELVAQGKDVLKAYAEVEKHSDLPDSKADVEIVRQPEQLELPAEHIRKIT